MNGQGERAQLAREHQQGEREQLARENQQLHRRVDELERASAAHADSARFLEALLGAAPVFITRVDHDLRILFANHYQPGLRPEEVVGRPVFEFIAEEFHARARAVLEHTRATGEHGRLDTIGAGAHGSVAYYETHTSGLIDPQGRMGVCLISRDVTAHKLREHALNESQEKLRVALEATGLGLWSWDVDTGEITWDDAMQRLHGCCPPSDLQGYVESAVHPLDRAEFSARARRVLETGRWESSPYRIVRPNGDVRWILSNGRVVPGRQGRAARLMGGTLDITESRTLEEQLRQAQKMDALGNMTAGIAHNFNNMLAVIMPTLEHALPLVPAEQRVLLREASHAASRAAELVRQLMTFGGQTRVGESAVHGIEEIVEAAVSICRRAFDRRIELRTVYDEPRARILCNARQIEQVLVNLLLNARDAVLDREQSAGHVTVRVRTHAHAPNASASEHARQPNVCIEISDDGVGMSELIKSKALEPFFTTRAVGRGTGLGLTTSYAIVRDHHGTLTCESEPGVGTTFTITLPIAAEPRADATVRAAEKPAEEICTLIVDDEPAVRGAVGQVLIDAGFRVLGAGSGVEALAVLQREPADVVLLDRSMPDAPGETFVPQIRKLAPSARIVFFTGQMVDPDLAALADGIVHKPVLGQELLEAIRRTLAGPTP